VLQAALTRRRAQGLQMGGLTIDERLDVLLHVKWTVKEFDCALTRELVSLIDREADLLNRGRSETTLAGAPPPPQAGPTHPMTDPVVLW
jgi:hypothetical protein